MTKREMRNEAFARLRACVRTIRQLEDALETATLSSRYIRRVLEREKAKAAELEENARQYTGDLTSIEYEFVIAFFFMGMSIKETSVTIDRCTRQCERLRSKFGKKGGTDRRIKDDEEENTNETDRSGPASG